MEDPEGRRRGGYLVLKDADGRFHALRATAVIGISEIDDGGDECVLTLPGGRLLRVPRPLGVILDWIS
ncbi:hypothetical protein HL658_19895 [Azospirillum sp. RWY-5-1]|uniref:Uncharacterized protein n=1 Tax=Azospirillum oleiclasticum TaxID=2735135 RepID=A0ABX2TCY6_9PROT|nr:hypothetical protein [Azospirillum oleiclasticum]NYZ14815.1 hypothetical protein [Azospirillum oleiclasticum]NYZ22199.1 hypothetical protein [Azospirillum oleiclasticum]